MISYPSSSVGRRYLYPSLGVICCPSLSESVSSRYVLPVAICHPLPVILYPDNGCRYPLTLFVSHYLILIRSPAFATGCPLPATPTSRPSLFVIRRHPSSAARYPGPLFTPFIRYPFVSYYLLVLPLPVTVTFYPSRPYLSPVACECVIVLIVAVSLHCCVIALPC